MSRRKRFYDPNKALLWLSPGDPLYRVHLWEHCLALGRSGSGKTSSLLSLAIALCSDEGGWPCYATCAKPMDGIPYWRKVFTLAGKPKELLIPFGPDHPWRFNPVAWLSRIGAGVDDYVQVLTTLSKAFRKRSSMTTSSEGAFFEDFMAEIMRNVLIVLVAVGKDEVSLDNMSKFLRHAAQHPSEFVSPEWRARYHFQCLKRALYNLEASMLPLDQAHDLQNAVEYWSRYYPAIDPRTRSGGEATCSVLFSHFQTGWLYQTMGRDTNITPEDILENNLVLVNDTPVLTKGHAGLLCNLMWKLCWMLACQRRPITDATPGSLLWQDEVHHFVIPDKEALYLSTARAFRSAVVSLTQGVSSLYDQYGGGRNEAAVDSWLGNNALKLFFCSDAETAEYFGKLCGHGPRRYITGGGSVTPRGVLGWVADEPNISFQTHETIDWRVNPTEVTSNLRTGGKKDGFVCDAWAHHSGRTFKATGKPYMKISFAQK